MALPALQEALLHLGAELRERSAPAARAGDVVSLPMAKIINFVDEAVGREDARRLRLIEANRSLTEALNHPEALYPDDVDDYADVLVRTKRTLREVSRSGPGVADSRSSLMTTAELLRSINLPQSADGAVARRQAARIEECAKSSENERLKLQALTERAVALMEANVAGNEAFDLALKRAIGRQSIDRYPVINDYLAR